VPLPEDGPASAQQHYVPQRVRDDTFTPQASQELSYEARRRVIPCALQRVTLLRRHGTA